MKILEQIMNNTIEYIEKMPKNIRKKYGQFFTSLETSRYMANLFDIKKGKKTYTLLDAGAGSGILTGAFVEMAEKKGIESLEITCYENDNNILNLLESNLKLIQRESSININCKIINENYITSQYLEFNDLIGANKKTKKYDFVIGNPPYLKISKDAEEALAMPTICYGAPNLYFLFASMGLFNLKNNSEMVYIIPRSWTSGTYFKKFREYLLSNGNLKHIHLFKSRNKVFDKENVLQETMIIKVQKKLKNDEYIKISTTESNTDFDNILEITVPYELIVSGKEKYVYLITDTDELKTLKTLKQFNQTLPSIGYKMKTGLTVDFRNRGVLRNKIEKDAIPLFYSQHIKDGKVEFPINRENEYIVTDKTGLKQKNKNYLFIKRFTSKEEKRRLQCGMYFSRLYPQYDQISTQNKVNFIDNINDDEMPEDVLYGLYVLFNSSIYDNYYRILNGSTQVNSTEINCMPIPKLEVIEKMGRCLIKTKDLSQDNCNKILEENYV